MSPERQPPGWMAYVGVALTCATIGWGAITQWFTLQQRVTVLEMRERYQNGKYELPPEAK